MGKEYKTWQWENVKREIPKWLGEILPPPIGDKYCPVCSPKCPVFFKLKYTDGSEDHMCRLGLDTQQGRVNIQPSTICPAHNKGAK